MESTLYFKSSIMINTASGLDQFPTYTIHGWNVLLYFVSLSILSLMAFSNKSSVAILEMKASLCSARDGFHATLPFVFGAGGWITYGRSRRAAVFRFEQFSVVSARIPVTSVTFFGASSIILSRHCCNAE
uniref:Uncharacterized protein n=1 Tax=Cacopsylla melanoneura TaxID=428564 RepID=A0A8D8QTT5_9HEMI